MIGENKLRHFDGLNTPSKTKRSFKDSLQLKNFGKKVHAIKSSLRINQLDSIIFHFNGCPAFKRFIGSVSQDQSLATIFKGYLNRFI